MDIKKRKDLAKKVFNALKADINEAKKWNKEHPNATGWGKCTMVGEMFVGMKYGWQGAKDDCYQIRVGRQWYDAPVLADKITSLYDLQGVVNEVVTLINEQKKVKGWGTLNIAYDTAEFGYNPWCRTKVKYPSKVTLCEKPCKEFTALQNYLNKYGSANLRNFELFCSAMGGKRGVLWDEYGDRRYLDNKPNKCANYLETLRKAKGSKDIMKCTRGEENYIDPIDRAYSEMHEIECDGEKRKYMVVQIFTPANKLKSEIKIY